MDMDKRYCQNRQRKRKRAIPTSQEESNKILIEEDERQFKLKRYIEDVGKYLSEIENCKDQKSIPKTNSFKPKKSVKKVRIPKPMMNKSLLHGGMQTKVFTRSGVMTKEMTTRLDEDLKQIISLGKSINLRCQCAENSSEETRLLESGHPVCQTESQNSNILKTFNSSREDPHLLPNTPTSPAGVEGEAALCSTSNAKTLSELDKELYPLFARVVSVSSTQTKSKLFKNHNPPFKLTLPKFHFESSTQLLEESIGPSSICSQQMVPSPKLSQLHHQYHQPSTTSLLSPPVVDYQRPQRVSKGSKYVHEPFFPNSPYISPLYNFKPRTLDGSGDGFGFNCYNSFLPPIEEEDDSPDFRYYPRKIF